MIATRRPPLETTRGPTAAPHRQHRAHAVRLRVREAAVRRPRRRCRRRPGGDGRAPDLDPLLAGDDVGGFEASGGELGGGLAVTGNYPGKARTPDELRADAEAALAVIPGKHRFNLHAIYAETGGERVERDAVAPEHFAAWIDWAKSQGLGLDFNPSYFSHPLAESGLTLSHADASVRRFWIDTARRAAGSPRRWARRPARPASRTSGRPTA